MSWRKWCIRGLVFTIMGFCALAALFYQRWTHPAAVREQVVAKLEKMFPWADVSVDSARMRLLGGIIVHEMRLCRRDDPDKVEILNVPSAILYHNKEKILDGELSLRKVELNRPRIRLTHEKDGTWNLSGISGPSRPDLAVPTIVIQQGVVVFEDRTNPESTNPIEIGNINLSVINDPLPTLVLNGSATSDILGALELGGHVQRANGEMGLMVKAKGTPLRDNLLQRAGKLGSHEQLKGLTLDALADLEIQAGYVPERPDPWRFFARVQVTQGKVDHPQLPLPLSDLQAVIELCNGTVRVPSFKARSGQATLKGHAFALLPNPDQFFEADLEIKHLLITPELTAKLPEKTRILKENFNAAGMIAVRIACAKREGNWVALSSGYNSKITLLPENGRFAFNKFQYPLQRVTGSLEWDLMTKEMELDITGYTHDRPVLIRGSWAGEKDQVSATFDIQASDVPIDDVLLQALPPNFEKLARSFHPAGKIDLKSSVRHEPGMKSFITEYHIFLHEGTMHWDGFPYPLKDVSAFLDIYPKHWEFREGRGSHSGGTVQVHGRSLPADPRKSKLPGDGLFLEINGRNLGLDSDLRRALQPMGSLGKAWDAFQPQGRVHFTAAIEQYPGNMDVRLDVRGGSVQPVFFPFALNDINGFFRFNDNKLTAQKVRARHNDTTLEMDFGTVDIFPQGGYYTDFRELRVQQLRADADLLSAMPTSLRHTMRAINLTEPIDLKTRLVIAQKDSTQDDPDIYWDGQAWLKNTQASTGVEWSKLTGTLAATGRFRERKIAGLTGNFVFDHGSLLKQPISGLQGKFVVHENTPDMLNLNLHAPLYTGDVTGQVRVEFNSAMRYEVNLTASQVDLQKFSQHNMNASTQMSGNAVARLHLSGQGADIDTLDGNGSLDVPNGRIYNLPLLLDLLKFLGLRWPDRTAFEEMHALFSVHGKRVHMRRLELMGNAVSLSGKGEFNLDGSDLHLDFYPSWARIEMLLPPAVRTLPPAISKNFLTIEMRGKVSSDPKDLRFNKKIVPVIVDPLMYMRDHMIASPARDRTRNDPGKSDGQASLAGQK